MKAKMASLAILFFSYIAIFNATDSTGNELQSADQLTKDLIVTDTRGITVKPHENSTAYGADFSREKSQGRVDMYIQFEYAKSNLTEKSEIQLQELAKAINDGRLKDDSFLIAGHTDAIGNEEYNLMLSEKRANSVVEYLISTLHIDRSRLIAKGFGENLLRDKSNPYSGENRRVEVVNTKILQ